VEFAMGDLVSGDGLVQFGRVHLRWYAQPGFHIVNKLGQVMNRKPWSDSTRNAIDFLDDLDHRPDKLPW
jgi:hypothetical protein